MQIPYFLINSLIILNDYLFTFNILRYVINCLSNIFDEKFSY